MIESLRHIWQEVGPHIPVDLLGRTPVVAGAAAAMAMGILMLVWARPLARALLALVGVGAGLALGAPAAHVIGVDILIAQVALAAVLGLVGLLLTRVVWALLLAALTGATTGAVMILHHLQWIPATGLPEFRAETQPWNLWDAAVDYFWGYVTIAYQQHAALMLSGVLGAVVIGLAAGVLFPTLATITAASMVGAILVVVGSQAIFLGAGGQPFPQAMGQPLVALGSVGILMLAGLAVQGLSAGKARKEKKEADASQDDEDDGDDDDGDE